MKILREFELQIIEPPHKNQWHLYTDNAMSEKDLVRSVPFTTGTKYLNRFMKDIKNSIENITEY